MTLSPEILHVAALAATVAALYSFNRARRVRNSGKPKLRPYRPPMPYVKKEFNLNDLTSESCKITMRFSPYPSHDCKKLICFNQGSLQGKSDGFPTISAFAIYATPVELNAFQKQPCVLCYTD